MNKHLPKLIAVEVLVSTAVSSNAAQPTIISNSPARSTSPASPTTPTVQLRKAALNSAELVKYQQLADESQSLATQQAAGATDKGKVVLITVGVIGIVALAVGLSNVSPGMPSP